jgi:hypothetical protein
VNRLQIVLGIVLAAFAFETGWAILHFGYVGFFEELLKSYPAMLAVADLTIALSLVAVWMWRDARERGATLWPYLALTVFFGSVGPLLYLIVREGAKRRETSGVRAAQPA